MHQRIVILDFGSQYTQLIARRVREAGVYSEILPCTASPSEVRAMAPQGLILSGSPFSLGDADAPQLDPEYMEMKREDGSDMPVMGVCYGLMAMCVSAGGSAAGAEHREFGRAHLIVDSKEDLFHGLHDRSIVWMSHGDRVTALPETYDIIGHTDNAPIAAVRSRTLPHFGVQFHPEVVHSEDGRQILENFTHRICGCRGDWSPASFIDEKIAEIREKVGDEHVLLGLSGGVDSSVAAVLLHQALGDQLSCVFVDNGLLRKGEYEQVQQTFRDHFHIRLKAVDASDLFLERLSGVIDPEEKRKIIGAAFVDVFDQATDELVAELGHQPRYLAQGTLYPDVIESISFKGPSATIKSHHNVGGLPEEMKMEVLEPFRELFKDEVRAIGRLLEVPPTIVNRHPFPGPGLGIRVIGEIHRDDLDVLREADAIYIQELHNFELYHEVWQAFAVLLPVQTVGVMGDGRTYENVCALRAVTSLDGMTADWAHLPHEFLAHVSNRIVNEVKGINRVVYDVSSKPPATIEWE